MARDIDYAAIAVNKALAEKFGPQNDLQELTVTALEKTIAVQHGQRLAEASRDDLLAAVRKSADYASLWQLLQVCYPPQKPN